MAAAATLRRVTVPPPPTKNHDDDGPWGEAIQFYLRERRMSQAEICRMTKLTSNTVSKAARGFHTNTQTLTKIARALGVSLKDLMADPHRPSAPPMTPAITEMLTHNPEVLAGMLRFFHLVNQAFPNPAEVAIRPLSLNLKMQPPERPPQPRKHRRPVKK